MPSTSFVIFRMSLHIHINLIDSYFTLVVKIIDVGRIYNSVLQTSNILYIAELSGLPAQTKLMPLRYIAELRSLPAQTKLMPLRYMWMFFEKLNDIYCFLPSVVEARGVFQ